MLHTCGAEPGLRPVALHTAEVLFRVDPLLAVGWIVLTSVDLNCYECAAKILLITLSASNVGPADGRRNASQ
jgi:hypothetical protein